MTPTAMLTFYRTVADRSPLPIIIYNFPPAPYSPYNFGAQRQSPAFVELDYILVDPKASALEANPIADQNALEHLRAMPEWAQIASKENLLLFKRK